MLADTSSGLYASDTRHLDIHKDDVGMDGTDDHDGVLAGTGLADHLESIDRVQ